MDDLTRAAQQLLYRPELAPPPIAFVERGARRHRRRVRTGIATGLGVLAVVLVLVVALVADDPGQKQNIIATQPATSVPAPTRAPSPTTAVPPSTAAAPVIALPHTSYQAGDFDVTEYSFQVNTGFGPSTITLTPGAVWVGTGNTLVRVDAATGSIVGTTPLDGSISALTSTAGTVFVLTGPSGAAAPARIVAFDARTAHERWRLGLGAGATKDASPGVTMALGRDALWAAVGTVQTSELLNIDPASGSIRVAIPLPRTPTHLVATPTDVWLGTTDSYLLRFDIVSRQVTPVRLDYEFAPMGADEVSVWGVRVDRNDASRSRLVRLGERGNVAIETPFAANGFAISGTHAWLTTQFGGIAIIDPSVGRVEASGNAHTLMNQGPADIHVLDGVGWAVNTYSNLLVRITRR